LGSGYADRIGDTLSRCIGINEREEVAMLWTIFVILLVLWLLGVVTSYTLGGFIHVLLVIAVIMAVMQLIQGRRAL
jgi:4-hydroxybenzoate polyprenyltransferase